MIWHIKRRVVTISVAKAVEGRDMKVNSRQ